MDVQKQQALTDDVGSSGSLTAFSQRISAVTILRFLALVFVSLSLTGCPWDTLSNSLNQASDVAKKEWSETNNHLGSFVTALEKARASTNDGTIKNQIDEIIQNANQSMHSGLRQDYDFFRTRLREDVEAVLSVVRGTTPPKKKPYLASVATSGLTFRPEATKTLDFAGWNLLSFWQKDQISDELQLYIEDEAGNKRPYPKNNVNTPTSYALSLRLRPELFNANDTRLVFKWQDEVMATFGINVEKEEWCRKDPQGELYQVTRSYQLANINEKGYTHSGVIELPEGTRFYRNDGEGDDVQRRSGIGYTKRGAGADWSYSPNASDDHRLPFYEVKGTQVVWTRTIGGLPTAETYTIYYEKFRPRIGVNDLGFPQPPPPQQPTP